MALVEGGGGVVESSGNREGKKSSGRSRTPSTGVTRLQQYTAPSDTFTASGAALGTALQGSRQETEEKELQTYEVPDTVNGGYKTVTVEEAAPEKEANTRDALQLDDVETESKTYRARKAKEMSWDDYLGLTDRARAAVDFNTMLVQARQKDLNTDYDTTDAAQVEKRKVYDKAVERMFGEDGGSVTFAPETVAMLTDVGFERSDAKRFDDLDDFLGLKSALTARDLDKLGSLQVNPLAEGAKSVTGLANEVAGTVEQGVSGRSAMTTLASGTDALRESLTRGDQVLQNWRAVSSGARNETLGFFGGELNEGVEPKIQLSRTAASMMNGDETYFDYAFKTLSGAPEEDKDRIMGLITADLKPKGLLSEFVKYIDTKSQYATDSRVVPGGDPSVRDRTPKQFRELLGLNKDGDDNGSR